MKKKRCFAFLIALTLIAASVMPTAAFADTISKEAKACKELGILIGKDISTGVTSEYLAETPTRIQALIIFLRIQGLDDEALTYDWDKNFDDADNYDWVVGRNYLGYAKENPDLGWIGSTDGKFYPNNTIDSKAFYKVMLESLGYNQDIDFDYSETLDFAQSIGLLSNAKTMEKLKDFTIDHVAKAIYATLGTKPKGEKKNLITLMTEKGIIDDNKAAKAGFIIEAEEMKVLSFEKLSNNRFVLTLDEEIPLDKDDINITPENGKKEISIESIETSGNKVYITTAFMPAFEAYNLTIEMNTPVDGKAIKKYSKKFVALPRDTKKPAATAEILSNNVVQVTFDKEVDKATAEDINNYVIQNDLDVYEAELDYTGKIVTLTTASHREGKRYWLEIRHVTDLSGNTMEFYEKSYIAQPKDTTKPSIVSIQSESSKMLLITFSEPLNRITAERTENYIVTNDAFSIEEAILDETGKAVTLITGTQNPDSVYKITVKNIADLAGNVMYEITLSTNIKDLQGLSVDSSSRKFDLSGSDIELPQFEILTGTVGSDRKTITLITSNSIKNTSLSMDCFDITGGNYGKSSSDKVVAKDRTISIILRNELKANSDITVKLTNTGKSTIKDLNNQKLDSEELVLPVY
jgi:hypothetical protein